MNSETHLPLPPECWDYRRAPPLPGYFIPFYSVFDCYCATASLFMYAKASGAQEAWPVSLYLASHLASPHGCSFMQLELRVGTVATGSLVLFLVAPCYLKDDLFDLCCMFLHRKSYLLALTRASRDCTCRSLVLRLRQKGMPGLVLLSALP